MATVTRIPLAYNSVYLLEEAGRRLLIDTGPDFRGAAEAIDADLGSRPPDLVLATHGHLDHAGLGRHWQERGVPVAVAAADHHLVSRPALSTEQEFRGFARYIEESGAPPVAQAEMLSAIEQRREWAQHAAKGGPHPPAPPDRRWPTGLRYRPFEPELQVTTNRPVAEGLPGQVLLSPGHTPGNLVVVFPAEGWLFSGDQLLPEITPTPAIQSRPAPNDSGDWRFHSLPAFVSSLRALDGMHFARCFPGHGEPFGNVNEVIEANLSQVEQRAERVLSSLRDDGPASPFELCERLYPRAARRRPWQILATVQGHLDLLEAEGRAAKRETLYWPAV